MAYVKSRCATHPRAFAGWRCTGCARELCPECVGEKSMTGTILLVCVHCLEAAERLQAPRSEIESFAARLPFALIFPLSRSGLLTLLGASIFLWLCSFAGWIGMLIGQGVLWSYVFTLARRSAHGSNDLDPPDFSDLQDLTSPMFRGLVAIFISWLPAIAFLMYLSSTTPEPRLVPVPSPAAVQREADPQSAFDELGLDEQVERDLEATQVSAAFDTSAGAPEPLLLRAAKNPLFWLFLLLGFLVGPMALAIGIAGGSILEMANPVKLFGSVARFPGPYALFAVSILAIGFGQWIVVLIANLFELLPVPIIPAIIGGMLVAYLPLVAGRVIGLYLYVHGAALGYMDASDGYEPALPGAIPLGVLPDAPAVAAQSSGRQRAAVEDAPAAAGLFGAAANWAPTAMPELPPDPTAPAEPAYSRPREISLDDEPDAPAAAQMSTDVASYDARAFDFVDSPEPAPDLEPLDPALALRRAVEQSDFSGALVQYRVASPDQLAELGAEAHYEIGRQAATEGDFPIAVRALKAAAQLDPNAPVAPRALVVMGRVLGERMGDTVNATKVFQHIVRAYPGTEAAKFAAGRLSPRG